MFGAVRSLQQLVTESQKSIVSLHLCSAESSWRKLLGLLRDGIAFASISCLALSLFGSLSVCLSALYCIHNT
jgi:hypothetical protein